MTEFIDKVDQLLKPAPPILGLFHHAFLLNLPEDWARRERVLARLLAIGIEPEIFPGIRPDPSESCDPWKSHGRKGCFLSHVEMIKEAKKRGLPNVLICEDDATFHPDFLKLWNLMILPTLRFRTLAEPEGPEWDLLYFYTRLSKLPALEGKDPCVVRIDGEVSTHFYAVHSRFYDRYLDECVRNKGLEIDVVLKQSKAFVLSTHPIMAGQEAGYSNLTGTWRTASYLPDHTPDALRSGKESILLERDRQIRVEGFDVNRDDMYKARELYLAAFCFEDGEVNSPLPSKWPATWEPSWWKPGPTKTRMLEKAGALYLAEAERLERLIGLTLSPITRGHYQVQLQEAKSGFNRCAHLIDLERAEEILRVHGKTVSIPPRQMV
jgi:hypothetical protein